MLSNTDMWGRGHSSGTPWRCRSWVDVVHHPIADLQLALADVLQPGDHPQQGGLAAPRRADEHHELAVAYLQVDIGALVPPG